MEVTNKTPQQTLRPHVQQLSNQDVEDLVEMAAIGLAKTFRHEITRPKGKKTAQCLRKRQVPLPKNIWLSCFWDRLTAAEKVIFLCIFFY
jgi:hypothetical protein